MFSQELYQYIKNNIGQKSPDEIKQALLRDGWQAAAIEEALWTVQKERQAAQAVAAPGAWVKKNKPLKLWLVLGIFCLVLAGVASFFYSRSNFCPGTHQIRLVLYLYSMAAIFGSFLLLAWLMPKVKWPHHRALKILGFTFFILLMFDLILFFLYIFLLVSEGALKPEQAIVPYFLSLCAAVVALPMTLVYLVILIKKYFGNAQSLSRMDKFFFLGFIFFWALVAIHFLAGGYAGLTI